MIESDTLASNWRVGYFGKKCRYNHYDPGCSVGWVTSLWPVRVSTLIDASVSVFESLALLQLSNGDLIVHTMIMNESSGERKLKVPAIVLLLILKLLC
jgi:hypothetical protein